VYARHGGRERVRRRPSCLEQIKADFARFEIDIWVADGCYEANGGRDEGICGRNGDGEEPAAVWGGLVGMCLCVGLGGWGNGL